MSKSAFSSKVFAVYVFLVGAVFVMAPNSFLSIFGVPETTEVWIHVVGVLAFSISVYAWVAADSRPFLVASIYTRLLVFVAFGTFSFIGLAHPVLALFGLVDLLGGMWTYFALRADALAVQPLRGGSSAAGSLA